MVCRIYLNDVDYFITGVCYRSQDMDDYELAQLFDAIKLACDTDHPTLTSCARGDTICPRSARCTHAGTHLQSLLRALRHEYS